MKAEEIAKRLTDFRKSQHITIKELSKKLNMELATLSAQLSGKRGVAVSTINGIIELYPQLSLEWVMLGRGNMFVSEEKHEHLTTHAEVAKLKNLVAQKDEEIKCLNAQVEVLMRTLQGKIDY
jgi:transcriptional regulator with XRE-family HTH domain